MSYDDIRHVSPAELVQARDPEVGDGTPASAPRELPDADPQWVGPVRTVGASPKLILTTVAAVLAYLLTQQLVDFPAWADLLISVAAVALAAWRADPGVVERQ